MRQRTGDLKFMQELNRSIIFNTIREQGPISRSDIAKKNKISPTTVTTAVNEFIQAGLVYEVGTGQSTGGRKPILIQFNPDGRFLLCLSITNTTIQIAELNLQATIRYKKNIHLHSLTGEAFIHFVCDSLEHFLKRFPDLKQCVGVSITVPGIIDSEKGIIKYNSKLQLENIPLRKIVEEKFHLNTFIENDVNAMALAEKYYGNSTHSSNLIFLSINEGLGAGILIKGLLFRGYHGGAGELGHTSINPNGPQCECGNFGCLENYVNWSSIDSRVQKLLESGYTSCISDLLHQEQTQLTPQIFTLAVQQEDSLALKIMNETCSYLSIGIVNLVHLFNPQTIIIGGMIAKENPYLIHHIKETINKRSMNILTEGLEILPSSFKEDAELKGGAAVLLQDLFQFSINRLLDSIKYDE
ncbi:N-acetylglucosamine repressor [Heyndrickxia sporothermodurans]|nr:N-acetylglucosamine repressor [Heyndrickxia sporothermodurans]